MKFNYSLPFILALFFAFAACDNSFIDDDDTVIIDDDTDSEFERLSGVVTGTLGPNETYLVTADIFIPEGESLTLMEGTTLIMDGTGRPGRRPEINVSGSLYSYGTEGNPVYIGVKKRKEQW